MAEFKKLGEVERLTEVPEGANAFIEIDGEVKRVPGEGLGGSGGGGIKTAIIKSSDYDSVLSGVQPSDAGATYECINMTLDEACQIIKNGEPLMSLVMFVADGNKANTKITYLEFRSESSFGFDHLVVNDLLNGNWLFWTEDGISIDSPSYGGPA